MAEDRRKTPAEKLDITRAKNEERADTTTTDREARIQQTATYLQSLSTQELIEMAFRRVAIGVDVRAHQDEYEHPMFADLAASTHFNYATALLALANAAFDQAGSSANFLQAAEAGDEALSSAVEVQDLQSSD